MLRQCTRRLFSQLLFASKSKLKPYNSETLTFQVDATNPAGVRSTESVQVPRGGTLTDLKNALVDKYSFTDSMFMCNQRIPLDEGTPVEILLNRYFYFFSKETNILLVEGDLFDQIHSDTLIEGLETVELPATTKNEMDRYFKRVNQWVAYKTGKSILDSDLKLSGSQAAEVFLQAVIDPLPQSRDIAEQEQLWTECYWRVQELKQKKRAADQLCLKKVKRRMSLGLAVLASNIGFIWSGTYVFYSWDIVEPIAYFMSSLGAIVLASQFFRLRKPFSNGAYQEYLLKKWAPSFYTQAGFSEKELLEAEYQLLEMEAGLKDHILRKL